MRVTIRIADSSPTGERWPDGSTAMSYVIAVPEMLATAAEDVAAIGSSLGAANSAAAAPTMGVLAAGADEVSAALAALFSSHGQQFRH